MNTDQRASPLADPFICVHLRASVVLVPCSNKDNTTPAFVEVAAAETRPHSDALAIRDGVALFAGPGGVPVVFDYEGVSQVVGDLAERDS